MQKYVDRWHPANVTDDPYNPATQWVAGKFPGIAPRLRPVLQDNGNRWNVWYYSVLASAMLLISRLKSYGDRVTICRRIIYSKGIGLNSDLRIFVNGSNLLDVL